jgi:hypothetical protein
MFFVCEAVFVGLTITLVALTRHYHRQHLIPHGGLLTVIWLVSLITLLIICFCLRRVARPLAIVGWLSAFIVFVYALLTPEL